MFCIVDLHSITTAFEPERLHEATLAGAAMLFATGIDPERSIVFAQSHVTAHAEANWLLSAVTSSWRTPTHDAVQGQVRRPGVRPGRAFTYPVLMAGDILLYQTDIVPIGDDQRQHLELHARRRRALQRALRRDLHGAEGRLSRGGCAGQEPAGAGTAWRRPPPERAGCRPHRRRAGRHPEAVQDRGDRLEREIRHDPTAKAGISNLIEILSVATGAPIAEIERRYDGSGYGQFKEDVGEAGGALAPIQERYRDLRADEQALRGLLAEGAERAREASRPTLDAMYERMGFVRLSQRLVKSTEPGHLALRQLARFPDREPFDVEARVTRASQAPDRMTHASHIRFTWRLRPRAA